MSRELLGVPFDIHGGGYDLIFPHHENEIAQSEPLMPPHEHMANSGCTAALLNFDGRKMSKSLGNFEPLYDLLARHDPLAIRLLFLQTGYRKPMNFTEDSIGGGDGRSRRLRKAYDALGPLAGAVTATARRAKSVACRATRAVLRGARRRHEHGRRARRPVRLRRRRQNRRRARRGRCPSGAGLLARGLRAARHRGRAHARAARRRGAADRSGDVERLRAALADAVPFNGESPEGAIERVIDARNAARKARDFALADRLRDALAADGIVLNDGKDGTTWTVAGE